MFGWLRKLFAPAVAPAPATVAVPKRSTGFFTADVGHERGDDLSKLDDYRHRLEAKVFQRTNENMKIATLTETEGGKLTYAMDSYDWSGLGENLKGIFTLDGCGVPVAVADWYGLQSFIGYQMCAMLSQHWLIDKALTMPARDATRNGYEITVNDGTAVAPEVLDYMRQQDKKFKVKWNAKEFVRHTRMYGVRIMLFEVKSDDPDYYLKPFNIDGVGPNSYEGMSQVDPYWITPELDAKAAADPASQHFYEPTYWRINGRRYHRTHLIKAVTCDVPDVLKPTYFYGGIPLPQRIYERVYAAERTANEAPALALSKRSTVIHVDMDAAQANEDQFRKNMSFWAYLRDNFGIKAVGTDEKVEQFDTSLADFDETVMTQYQIVAAIAEVPATKLLGTTPKGFNATGEYEESSYHEMLESIQEHDVAPLIERHHLLLIKSHVCPKFGIEMFRTTVAFNELDAETAEQTADRRYKESQTAKNYSDSGAVDGTDIRNVIIADKDSGYSGIAEVRPAGPQSVRVVDPGAPKTAPNDPTPAEQAAPPKAGGFGGGGGQ